MRAALLARKAATIGQSVDRAASDETRAVELAAGASSPSSGARLRLHSTLSPSLMGSPSPGGKRAEARARMTAYDEGEFDCAWSDDEHVLDDDSDHRIACDDNDDDDDDDEPAPPLYGDDGEQCLYSDDEAVQGESSARNSARRDCDDCMTGDGGEDNYEILRPRTMERSVWGWTDAEDEFPGLQFQVLVDDDHSVASACESNWSDACNDDDFPSGQLENADLFDESHSQYGEWADEEWHDAQNAGSGAQRSSRRDLILSNAESENRLKTACWTLREKNSMSESKKQRLALDRRSLDAACAFRCPCGSFGGVYCVVRIGLAVSAVENERNQTFAYSTKSKARLRFHATRLKSHVNVPARRTSEIFFPRQSASKFHWFLAGRPVCQETYAEVCALGDSSIAQIRKLANDAFNGDLDLSVAPVTIFSSVARQGLCDQRTIDLKTFMEDFARDSCEAIPDGHTIDSLSSDAADMDLQRDEDDGGSEWRLPFRSCHFIWKVYCSYVPNPYSYTRFLVKWHLHCRHIKRAGKGKDHFCQCDLCLGFKRELASTQTSQARRKEVHRESNQHNMFQMAQVRSVYDLLAHSPPPPKHHYPHPANDLKLCSLGLCLHSVGGMHTILARPSVLSATPS